MFITTPPILDRKIRFALAGCGRISGNHFDALQKHAERAELVGVCDIDPAALERAVLSESPEGRAISASFIDTFGEFVASEVRPILRDVAAAGGEPQLLMNGLAQLLREVADSVELPLGAARPSAGPADGSGTPGTLP